MLKRVTAAVAAAGVAMAVASPASARAIPSSGIVYATTAVNVRACASTRCAKLGLLQRGWHTGVRGASRNGWTPVNYGGRPGWVPSTYITPGATTRPAPKPAGKGVASRVVPGTSVSASVSQQVMVADRTSGSRGTWARYEWRGAGQGWVKVSAAGVGSVFGSNGVVAASQRRQGTGTTPAGTFGVVHAFGTGNPGTKLSYRTINACSWWIEDPAARDYNRWRQDCSALSKRDNEHMADYAGSQYRQGVVLDYNYYSPVRRGAGSGAGIFLHYATRYTGGCVGINSHSELTATLRWLDPAKNPRIVIKA